MPSKANYRSKTGATQTKQTKEAVKFRARNVVVGDGVVSFAKCQYHQKATDVSSRDTVRYKGLSTFSAVCAFMRKQGYWCRAKDVIFAGSCRRVRNAEKRETRKNETVTALVTAIAIEEKKLLVLASTNGDRLVKDTDTRNKGDVHMVEAGGKTYLL